MNKSIPIDAIVIGERRRQDNGDVQGLADSIAQYGLLHPPVVDAENRLVAGGRRLAACKSLGWQFIEVRSLGSLTDAELREIELEENLRRKDLTPTERSRTIVQLAETAAEIDRQEFRPDSGRNSGGRPAEPGSLRAVSERTGIPRSTIQEAKAHVETADAFPFMQKPDWKQYHVLEAREALAKLPEPEQAQAAALVDQPGIPPSEAIPIIRNLAEMKPDDRSKVFTLNESPDQRDRSLAITTAAQKPAMPDPRVLLIDSAVRELSRAVAGFPDDPEADLLRDVIARLREIKAAIKSVQKETAHA